MKAKNWLVKLIEKRLSDPSLISIFVGRKKAGMSEYSSYVAKRYSTGEDP